MGLSEFTKKIKRTVPVGTIFKNPGKGTSTVTDFTENKISYVRGSSKMYVSIEDLYNAYQRFKGQYITSNDLKLYKSAVFDSSARPAGHSCNCTFLYLLLQKLGLAGDIQGAGKRGNPFGIRIN